MAGHEMGQISPKDIFFTLQLLTTQKSLVKDPISAGVAQLVEHPICNRAVGSSSLSASTTFPITSYANTL